MRPSPCELLVTSALGARTSAHKLHTSARANKQACAAEHEVARARDSKSPGNVEASSRAVVLSPRQTPPKIAK